MFWRKQCAESEQRTLLGDLQAVNRKLRAETPDVFMTSTGFNLIKG